MLPITWASEQERESAMKQAWMAALVVTVFASSAPAQNAAWQFRWQKGQVLSYKIDHTTTVADVVEKNKVETVSKLNLIKRWQVADVDAQGVATLHMSLTAMRNEQTRPNGEVLLFDSANPEKSSPELKDQMSKYIGVTLAVIRIDRQGRVVEVKQGAAARYDAEPPFGVVFPAAAVAEGQAWQRPYTIALEPPLGNGEKHEAVQTAQCTKIEGNKATFAFKTQFKTLPDNPRDHVPLLQKMPEGHVVFDHQHGVVTSAQVVIDRTVSNHQGEGSSYRFQSRYVEQLISVK
jgi:hypothetical protein